MSKLTRGSRADAVGHVEGEPVDECHGRFGQQGAGTRGVRSSSVNRRSIVRAALRRRSVAAARVAALDLASRVQRELRQRGELATASSPSSHRHSASSPPAAVALVDGGALSLDESASPMRSRFPPAVVARS